MDPEPPSNPFKMVREVAKQNGAGGKAKKRRGREKMERGNDGVGSGKWVGSAAAMAAIL